MLLAEGDAMTGLAIIGIIVVLYFVPGVVATQRRCRSTNAICVLNLLLGWTFLGWVAALVWALADTPAATPVAVVPAVAVADQQCPHCLSTIPAAASVCRFCQRDVPRALAIESI